MWREGGSRRDGGRVDDGGYGDEISSVLTCSPVDHARFVVLCEWATG